MHAEKSSTARRSRLAPAVMRAEEDEQVCGAITPILAIVALDVSGVAGIGWCTSPMSWIGLSPKQTTGRFGSGAST
ncbi:hypothetical protein IVB26_06650 [Bradyrhizobium sp. 195]|nr:hypothetical protein IVB26_06650 [Bradyrhizobium sp. 195]